MTGTGEKEQEATTREIAKDFFNEIYSAQISGKMTRGFERMSLLVTGDQLNECGHNFTKVEDSSGERITFHNDEEGELLTLDKLKEFTEG